MGDPRRTNSVPDSRLARGSKQLERERNRLEVRSFELVVWLECGFVDRQRFDSTPANYPPSRGGTEGSAP
jgi:hypothetical protein